MKFTPLKGKNQSLNNTPTYFNQEERKLYEILEN